MGGIAPPRSDGTLGAWRGIPGSRRPAVGRGRVVLVRARIGAVRDGDRGTTRLGHVERAIDYLEVAIALDERLAVAHFQLAEILYHRGDDSAVGHYERLIALAPTPEFVAAAHTRIASRIVSGGDLMAAEAHLLAALRADSGSWGAEVGMARLAMARHQADEACRWLQSARRHAGDNPWVDLLERDVSEQFPQCVSEPMHTPSDPRIGPLGRRSRRFRPSQFPFDSPGLSLVREVTTAGVNYAQNPRRQAPEKPWHNGRGINHTDEDRVRYPTRSCPSSAAS